jgi:hypothetical protein
MQSETKGTKMHQSNLKVIQSYGKHSNSIKQWERNPKLLKAYQKQSESNQSYGKHSNSIRQWERNPKFPKAHQSHESNLKVIQVTKSTSTGIKAMK